MKYYLIAGEASGDLHASNLMAALKQIDSGARFRFMGGDLMQAEGGDLVKHYREMAFMGFIPVLKNLRTILRTMRRCEEDIRRYAPDTVILVDYPGFNLKIARFVKEELNLPVYYYISPKIWAWKKYRIKSIRRYVHKMLCILPFETEFYRTQRYEVAYVGNPSVDAIAAREGADETFGEFTACNRLDGRPVIALLAGSRRQEIRDNLPVMLEAASAYPDYQPVIAGAPGIEPEFYRPYIASHPARIVFAQTYRLLQQSRAALVTSGTATLETALLRVPQTVCYKVAAKHITYFIFKHFFPISYISLVNLIAGKEVVKELFSVRFSLENIRSELGRLLSDTEYRNRMLAGYDEIIETLGAPGASRRAAEIIRNDLCR